MVPGQLDPARRSRPVPRGGRGLRRPELRGRPVVVGGAGGPDSEGWWCPSASYKARACGCTRACLAGGRPPLSPEAVFLPLDLPLYEAASQRVRATLRGFPPSSRSSVGTKPSSPPTHPIPSASRGRSSRPCERERTRLLDRHRAEQAAGEMATGFAKPPGIYRLSEDNWMAVMGSAPRRHCGASAAGRPACSKRSASPRRRAGAGRPSWSRLLRSDDRPQPALDGAWAPDRPRSAGTPGCRARGAGDHVPEGPHRPRCRRGAGCPPRSRAGRGGGCGRIGWSPGSRFKVRVSPYFTRTSAVTLTAPTRDPGEIERAALTVLEHFDLTRPVRLLGLRVEYERAG